MTSPSMPARSNSIVMLSDGIETCGGDPCKLVTDLKAKGVNFTIHVIGLSVDGATRQQLQCVAQAAGGTYHDANSQQDLAQALGAVKSDVTKNEAITAHGVNTPTPLPQPLRFTPPRRPLPLPARLRRRPHQPERPGTDGLVFASSSNQIAAGNPDVYAMNPDGSSVTRLTNNPDWEGYAVWSPDQSRIAFVRHVSQQRAQLCYERRTVAVRSREPTGASDDIACRLGHPTVDHCFYV